MKQAILNHHYFGSILFILAVVASLVNLGFSGAPTAPPKKAVGNYLLLTMSLSGQEGDCNLVQNQD